jgi:hypothetical protein
MVGDDSGESVFRLPPVSKGSRSLLRIIAGVGSIFLLGACVFFLSSSKGNHETNLAIEESYLDGNAKAETASSRLFSWVNSFDDGKGTTSPGQHGGTQTISGCDAGIFNSLVMRNWQDFVTFSHLQMIHTAPTTCQKITIIRKAFGPGLTKKCIQCP